MFSKISLHPTQNEFRTPAATAMAREFVKNADLEQRPDAGNQGLHLNCTAACFLGTLKFENILESKLHRGRASVGSVQHDTSSAAMIIND